MNSQENFTYCRRLDGLLVRFHAVLILLFNRSIYVLGPTKIGHVNSQNLTTFQIFVTQLFTPIWYGHTIFSDCAYLITGFPTHLTEPKYYISELRNNISSNHMVYFSPHALFLQAWSHIQVQCILSYKFSTN